MQENKWNWELILVDDGSTDETAKNLEQCIKLSDSIRVLTLSKNFDRPQQSKRALTEVMGNI